MTFPQEMELIHNIWRGQIPLWKSFPYQKISETTYKRIFSLKKITFHSNFKENQAEPSQAESSLVLGQTWKFRTSNLRTSRKSNLEPTEPGFGFSKLNRTFQDRTSNLWHLLKISFMTSIELNFFANFFQQCLQLWKMSPFQRKTSS